MNEKLDLLSEAFGLNKGHRQMLLRIGWVLVVSTHIAWACGWLVTFGLIGFARAADVEQLQRTVEISARIQLAQEIRLQVRARCTLTDQQMRDSVQRAIDNLQNEYARITAGQRYPEPSCS